MLSKKSTLEKRRRPSNQMVLCLSCQVGLYAVNNVMFVLAVPNAGYGSAQGIVLHYYIQQRNSTLSLFLCLCVHPKQSHHEIKTPACRLFSELLFVPSLMGTWQLACEPSKFALRASFPQVHVRLFQTQLVVDLRKYLPRILYGFHIKVWARDYVTCRGR